MSYKLFKDKVEIAYSAVWSAGLFSKLTYTSFPKEVTKDYVWEQDGYWLGWIPDPEPILPTPEELAAQQEAENERLRLDAYRNESDPLFFKWQRGEIEKQVWLDKVAEIKARYI